MKYTLPFKLNCPILFYPYKAHTTQPRSIKSPPSSTHMCSLIMSVITHNMPSLSIPVMAGLGRVEQQAHIAPRWTSSYSTERLAPPQRLTSNPTCWSRAPSLTSRPPRPPWLGTTTSYTICSDSHFRYLKSLLQTCLNSHVLAAPHRYDSNKTTYNKSSNNILHDIILKMPLHENINYRVISGFPNYIISHIAYNFFPPI